MDNLQSYANPRGKISRMLASGELIRVKKGLYVFGDEYRNGPVNRGILANLIYGPSYVSGLYALAQHGLILERVETVTSMVTQRNKQFDTPFGRFEYLYLNKQRYTVGVDWRQAGEYERCLFASPEKALADVVARERDIKKEDELLELLVENLRIEEDLLLDLNLQRMTKIAAAYGSPVIRLLNEALARMI
jgi:predicted transcriptional regulator of viral defense system